MTLKIDFQKIKQLFLFILKMPAGRPRKYKTPEEAKQAQQQLQLKWRRAHGVGETRGRPKKYATEAEAKEAQKQQIKAWKQNHNLKNPEN